MKTESIQQFAEGMSAEEVEAFFQWCLTTVISRRVKRFTSREYDLLDQFFTDPSTFKPTNETELYDASVKLIKTYVKRQEMRKI